MEHGGTIESLHEALRSGQVKARRVDGNAPLPAALVEKFKSGDPEIRALLDRVQSGEVVDITSLAVASLPKAAYPEGGLDPADKTGVVLVSVRSLREWHEGRST